MTSHHEAFNGDVIIAGAGPVGLLVACFLGQSGLKVLVLEKRTEPIAHSAAIGITPPSLHILAKVGLDAAFLSQGIKVRDCVVHGERGRLGCVSFRDIPDKYRWVLSLPQRDTIALLQQKLTELPNVELRMGYEVTQIEQQGQQVLVRSRTEAGSQELRARWLVACDGSRSRVRELLHVHAPGKSYPCHFVMGDFVEKTQLGDDAHLFFKADGSVESFPLPGGLRRWIVQVEDTLQKVPPGLISELVQRRTGIKVSPGDQTNQSTFTPRRFNCDRYYVDRVILCGDAAHGMSPIGGQGMNTGFADAEFLAEILPAILQRGQNPEPLLNAYQRYRRKAASTAIFRAEWGMWLGTWRGKLRSFVRDFIIGNVMCRWPVSAHMGPLYAMLTIPFNTLERVPLTRQTLCEMPSS